MDSILLIESGIFNTANDDEIKQLMDTYRDNEDIRYVMDNSYYKDSVKSFYNSDDIDVQRLFYIKLYWW